MEGRIMENPVTIKRQRRSETINYYIPLTGNEPANHNSDSLSEWLS